MTATEAMYREYCEGRLAMVLAGGIAMRRAERGSAPGWRRLRSRKELIAFHEAGHAVAAASVDFKVHTVFIVEPMAEPGKDGFAGACIWSSESDDPLRGAKPPHPNDMICDSRQASELCLHLAHLDNLLTESPSPKPTWKAALAYYHVAKARARKIINGNWYAIIDLAEALERRVTLNRAEVAGILAHNGL